MEGVNPAVNGLAVLCNSTKGPLGKKSLTCWLRQCSSLAPPQNQAFICSPSAEPEYPVVPPLQLWWRRNIITQVVDSGSTSLTCCGPTAVRSEKWKFILAKSRRPVTCSRAPISRLQLEILISHTFVLTSIPHQSQAFDTFSRTAYSQARYAYRICPSIAPRTPLQDLPAGIIRFYWFVCTVLPICDCPKLGARTVIARQKWGRAPLPHSSSMRPRPIAWILIQK